MMNIVDNLVSDPTSHIRFLESVEYGHNQARLLIDYFRC